MPWNGATARQVLCNQQMMRPIRTKMLTCPYPLPLHRSGLTGLRPLHATSHLSALLSTVMGPIWVAGASHPRRASCTCASLHRQDRTPRGCISFPLDTTNVAMYKRMYGETGDTDPGGRNRFGAMGCGIESTRHFTERMDSPEMQRADYGNGDSRDSGRTRVRQSKEAWQGRFRACCEAYWRGLKRFDSAFCPSILQARG